MRIVFHIGAPKTGTSSIQRTLKDSSDILREHGCLYLGLMLENAPVLKYKWQAAAAAAAFHKGPDDQGAAELYDVFSETIMSLGKEGIHTLIWSSESFFGRSKKAIMAIDRLKVDLSIDVTIVAYVRRHDLWARSGYVQWGIKHKTNRGRVRSFSEWLRVNKPGFFSAIKRYLDVFGDNVVLRNYDATNDLVADFLGVIGLGNAGIRDSSRNVTGVDAEIFLRALFNGTSSEPALVRDFDVAVGNHTAFNLDAGSYLQEWLPSSAQLERMFDACVQDVQALASIGFGMNEDINYLDSSGGNAEVEVEHDNLLMRTIVVAVDNMNRLRDLEIQTRGMADSGVDR